MKLTKEDYMCLPKERLAELLVERDNEKIEPIVIPSSPSIPPYCPWRDPYPWGPPYITWCDAAHAPNTATAHPDTNYAQHILKGMQDE